MLRNFCSSRNSCTISVSDDKFLFPVQPAWCWYFMCFNRWSPAVFDYM